MLRFVPLLLLGWMLAEIVAFVVIGGWIGALGVVLWVIAAGLLGFALIRRQGLKALTRLRAALDGRHEERPDPAQGLLTALAGLLLILPGFLSDAAALTLLLPIVRRRLSRRLGGHAAFTAQTHRRPSGQVIEGEAIEIVDAPGTLSPERSSSPWNR